MDDERYQTLENRLIYLEHDSMELHDRMGKVEDKASAAWKTITEVNTKVDRLEQKVDNLEKDMKAVKVVNSDTNKAVKTLTKVVGVLCAISGVFFIYIWRHDSELAKSLVSLSTLIIK